MNRRTLAGIILLLWVGALGWLVQREYLAGRGPAETATSWPVPPGAAFQAVRLGERQVGLASIAVDTVGDSLRVVSLTTLDLPSADTANPRRTSERVVAIYSRRLQLLRWQTDLLTELWVEPPVLENGRLRLAPTPGLGVRLPEGFLERHPFQPGSGEHNSVQGKMLQP